MLNPVIIEQAARAIVDSARVRATPDASPSGLMLAMEHGSVPEWAADHQAVKACNPGELASALYRAASRVH